MTTKDFDIRYHRGQRKERFHKKKLELPNLDEQSKCKSIVVENIDNVLNGKELTAPLKFLRTSCEFMKVYTFVFNNQPEIKEINTKLKRERWREYHKEYSKKYHQRPEVKERYKFRAREYLKRPEVKERRLLQMRERNQRPEVKEKNCIRQKLYYQRPGVREKKIEYSKKYYQKQKLIKLKKEAQNENGNSNPTRLEE